MIAPANLTTTEQAEAQAEVLALRKQLAAIRAAWKAHGCTMPIVYRCKMEAVINPVKAKDAG